MKHILQENISLDGTQKLLRIFDDETNEINTIIAVEVKNLQAKSSIKEL